MASLRISIWAVLLISVVSVNTAPFGGDHHQWERRGPAARHPLRTLPPPQVLRAAMARARAAQHRSPEARRLLRDLQFLARLAYPQHFRHRRRPPANRRPPDDPPPYRWPPYDLFPYRWPPDDLLSHYLMPPNDRQPPPCEWTPDDPYLSPPTSCCTCSSYYQYYSHARARRDPCYSLLRSTHTIIHVPTRVHTVHHHHVKKVPVYVHHKHTHHHHEIPSASSHEHLDDDFGGGGGDDEFEDDFHHHSSWHARNDGDDSALFDQFDDQVDGLEENDFEEDDGVLHHY